MSAPNIFDIPSPTLLIGIGNLHRGDDAVGRIVLRQMRDRGIEGVTFLEQEGEGTALMDSWSNSDAVFLIDALHRGREPGTVQRFDLRAQPIPAGYFSVSSHAFGVAEAVEMARALNRLPRRMILYGIEGSRFEIGAGLSPEVERAVEVVAQRLLKEMEADVRVEK